MTSPLDDTSRCPVAAACATCGGTDGLAVSLEESDMGVACLTLCDVDAGAGWMPPPTGLRAAFERVAEHATHLGLNLDQMAALYEQRRRLAQPDPAGDR